jgi:aryl-alcohol dehydrogenase-like predicted oxidoreductase
MDGWMPFRLSLPPPASPPAQVKEAVAEYAAIAAKYGLAPSELALAWCHSRWFVASTIIGATTLAQLQENIEAFGKALPEEAKVDIARVFQKYRDPTLNIM